MKLNETDIRELVEKDGVANIKYVRICNEFRYAIAGGPIMHKDLVHKHEDLVSAGFFSVYLMEGKPQVHLHSTASVTLNLGPDKSDENALKFIFDLIWRSK